MGKVVMKGVGKGGYLIKASDDEIRKALEPMVGEVIKIREVSKRLNTSDRRVKRVAKAMGLKIIDASHKRNPENAGPIIPHSIYDMFARECKKAIEENDLDNELVHLLCIITGVPIEHIRRLAAGEKMNIEVMPKAGVIYRGTHPPFSLDLIYPS